MSETVNGTLRRAWWESLEIWNSISDIFFFILDGDSHEKLNDMVPANKNMRELWWRLLWNLNSPTDSHVWIRDLTWTIQRELKADLVTSQQDLETDLVTTNGNWRQTWWPPIWELETGLVTAHRNFRYPCWQPMGTLDSLGDSQCELEIGLVTA